MRHDPPEQIATARLVLRRPRASDAAARYAYGSDPVVARYMDWAVLTSMEGFGAVDGAESRWETGEEYAWVITVRQEDRAIGNIACRVQEDAVDFGYVLARDQWGQGYATEAAKAVVAWAASLDEVRRITATCDVENAASVRVLEKLGMKWEGVLKDWAVRPNLQPGVARDAFLYARVREE